MTLIPADRLGSWTIGTTAGVRGGIPERIDPSKILNLVSDYGADDTGATDCSSAFQSALNDAGGFNDGHVVFLPEGTYKVDTGLSVTTAKKNFTVRGAGKDLTTINFTQSGGIFFSISSTGGSSAQSITAGAGKGNTVLTLSGGTSAFSANSYAYMFAQADPSIPVISQDGTDPTLNGNTSAVHGMMAWIVTKDSTTITISPPMYYDFSNGGTNAAAIGAENGFFPGIGFEDMAIVSSPSFQATRGLQFIKAVDCWAKNCKFVDFVNYGIDAQYCLFNEYRHCDFIYSGMPSSNKSGIVLNGVGATLIEDNVFDSEFPPIEFNVFSNGNVISYNYARNSTYGFDGNHSSHCLMNLFEGNVTEDCTFGYLSDNYRGGSSYNTLIRNFFSGYISLQWASYFYNCVGNISGNVIACGSPFGGVTIGGNVDPHNGSYWPDYDSSIGMTHVWTGTLSTRTDATNGIVTLDSGMATSFNAALAVSDGNIRSMPGYFQFVTVTDVTGDDVTITASSSGTLPAQGSAVTFAPSPQGFRQFDLSVAGSLIDKGNYVQADDSYSSTGGDTVPDSYIYNAKPGFFGSISWPVVNASASPAIPTYDDHPAWWRFHYGNENYLSSAITVNGDLIINGTLALP